MNTIGSFVLVKNEAHWIGPHLAHWLPHLDQMVFFDGNSTDGTLEIIKDFISRHPQGYKIVLVEDRDPKDLKDDYVRLFDAAMRALETDWAFFLHPDMIAENPEAVKNVSDGVAYSTRMRSFAGEPDGALFEIAGDGRDQSWQQIYRLRNPDLGAHYHGHYGVFNEGVYFSEITGDSHDFYGAALDKYPFEVKDSGLRILHYSDVRPYERRLARMKTCLANQKKSAESIEKVAASHPRVTLENGADFTGREYKFIPAQYPEVFKSWSQQAVAA